jgi:ribonuclease-3
MSARAAELAALQRRLGHTFARPELLEQALTHATWAHEHGGMHQAYERLEFLGDAVLQLLASEALFAAMPEASEGQLSRRRAQLVREEALAQAAGHLQLQAHVRLGAGYSVDVPASILADVVEGILAAAYLDAGLDAARRIFAVLWAHVTHLPPVEDHKTRLQELCHARRLPAPQYMAVPTGPAHARIYEVTLCVGEVVRCEGRGTSKKAAEQVCARRALDALDHLSSS